MALDIVNKIPIYPIFYLSKGDYILRDCIEMIAPLQLKLPNQSNRKGVGKVHVGVAGIST